MADAPTNAEIVLAALDSGEWAVERHMPQDWLTEEGNRQMAWSVKRTVAPYCSKRGPRVWHGQTAVEALRTAANDLGMELPATTPSPPVAAPPATPVAHPNLGAAPQNGWDAWTHAAQPQPQPAQPPYYFRRFVRGQERAEDVLVEKAATLDEAIKTAARICPSEAMTVLVLAPAPAWAITAPSTPTQPGAPE